MTDLENLRKKTSVTVLLAGIYLFMPGSQAEILTISPSELAQQVIHAKQQAREAVAQLKKSKEAIAQAKSQYDHYQKLIQGNSKLGDFLNDPVVNNLIPMGDWEDIYNDVESLPNLRQRYGLTSVDPEVQKAFDKLLMKAGTLEKEKKASDQRVLNAQKLRAKLNVVQTPQEKQDLSLRYHQEMLELQIQQTRLQNLRALAEEKEKLADRKRGQDFKDYMLGKRPDLPKYD
ncbi:type IV secretion system protein [Candidatus Williamhamiltonella defendens]|uniref:type IV secretion system protein n=1 Tax=Candidatus Williamhamiltonella defendens TaxID=138072 RepID=UPI0003180887|nr:type IV secretion system protein [Candidatus Hamiltonella defensa]